MRSYSITDECTGCTACARACPVGAIAGERKEKHVIDENACIRCGLCGRTCPSGAVLDANGRPTERVPKKFWMHPEFDASCVGCSLCIVNCPKCCIEIGAPEYHGDIYTRAKLVRPEDCIGCGLCVGACPIDAVTMAAPSQDVSD